MKDVACFLKLEPLRMLTEFPETHKQGLCLVPLKLMEILSLGLMGFV